MTPQPSHRILWRSHAPVLALSIVAASSLTACDTQIEIASHSDVRGLVNDAAMIGTITAKIDTAAGGVSTCTYTQLPRDFTAATLGTHT